jgi:YesN/AraC family two-component response regulator
MARGKTARKSQTVMLIDDETLWLDLIRDVLADESYKVITASSGEAALKKLHQIKPDLILSDVRMPVLNGFDLYERVRSDPRLRSIPYVFMSSINDFDAMRTARELGADDYFEKPFDAQSVKDIVLSLLMRFKTRTTEKQ